MQVTVTIPDEFAARLISGGIEPSRSLMEDAAIRAYCEDRISRHELRVILGFETGYELDGFLKSHHVEHGAYSGADLMEDVAVIDGMLAERENKLSR